MEALQMSCTTARTTATKQQPCRKKCMLLEKRANNAMSVSFSHIRTHKMQEVNLQWKRVWWVEGNSFVRLRLSTKAIKTLKNKPLQELASRVGLDLGKYRSR
ncbi:ribosomal L28 family-domain-containing protein [Baffinella frigidus]|nr:ribosomal L28 family-domain-containing protein [Cryptophyta sp. CCMP2293]